MRPARDQKVWSTKVLLRERFSTLLGSFPFATQARLARQSSERNPLLIFYNLIAKPRAEHFGTVFSKKQIRPHSTDTRGWRILVKVNRKLPSMGFIQLAFLSLSLKWVKMESKQPFLPSYELFNRTTGTATQRKLRCATTFTTTCWFRNPFFCIVWSVCVCVKDLSLKIAPLH